jgi:hypothetical protein
VGGARRVAGRRAMSGRALALTAAGLLVPPLWGWVLPTLLARVWPPRPPAAPPRPPLPDYEI